MGVDKNRRTFLTPAFRMALGADIATGKTWIDGKPIFLRVVDLGNLPNTGADSTPHGITDLGQVTDLRGIATSGSDGFQTLPKASPTDINNIQMTIDGGTGDDVVVVTGKDESSSTGYAFIEFTKA